MARLVDYDPHWINMPQAAPSVKFYVGLSFINPMGERGACPTCGHNRDKRLAVSFWPPIDPDGLLERQLVGNYDGPPNPHYRTKGETFDTLTLAPSIGLDPMWHGNIADGEITPAKPV